MRSVLSTDGSDLTSLGGLQSSGSSVGLGSMHHPCSGRSEASETCMAGDCKQFAVHYQGM